MMVDSMDDNIRERKMSIKEVEESINDLNVEMKRTKSQSKIQRSDSLTPIIPQENLTGLISRLASLSKLDSKACSTGNTSNVTSGNIESQNNMIKNMKHRETAILDKKFNIQEILNDKHNLLLTEDNILERSDISREEPLLKIQDKKEESTNINNFNNLSFSLDDAIEVNLTENIHIENTKLTNLSTNLKNKFNSRNDKSPLTNRATDHDKNTPNKKNFKTVSKPNYKINLKNPFAPKDSMKSKNNLETKSTTINIKNSINNKSKSPVTSKNPFSTSRVTFTPNSKLKLSTDKKSNINIVKTSKVVSSEKKSTKPLSKPNVLSTTMNRSTSKNTKTDETIFNKRNSLNNSKMDILNTSISKRKKNESIMNHSSMMSTEFNVIEEYDYHKILTELRAIFGDDLEFFDENSNRYINLVLFSNLDEMANKGLVKGLIKLCHTQDKKLKLNDSCMLKLKTQMKNELSQKDKMIRTLNDELSNLRGSLKGCKLLFILVIGDTLETEPGNLTSRTSNPKSQNVNKSFRTFDTKYGVNAFK